MTKGTIRTKEPLPPPLKTIKEMTLLIGEELWDTYMKIGNDVAPGRNNWHILTMCTLIGQILNDEVIVCYGRSWQPLRLYLLLLGLSSIGKTETLGAITVIAAELEEFIKDHDNAKDDEIDFRRYRANEGSLVKILDSIKKKNERSLWITDEYGTILQVIDTYGRGIDDMTMKTYKGQSYVHDTFANPIILSDPRLSHIGGTTITKMQEFGGIEKYLTGYMARYLTSAIFISDKQALEEEEILLTKEPETGDEELNDVVFTLNILRKLKNTPDMQRWGLQFNDKQLQTYLEANKKMASRISLNKELKPIYNRFKEYIPKLAAIFTIMTRLSHYHTIIVSDKGAYTNTLKIKKIKKEISYWKEVETDEIWKRGDKKGEKKTFKREDTYLERRVYRIIDYIDDNALEKSINLVLNCFGSTITAIYYTKYNKGINRFNSLLLEDKTKRLKDYKYTTELDLLINVKGRMSRKILLQLSGWLVKDIEEIIDTVLALKDVIEEKKSWKRQNTIIYCNPAITYENGHCNNTCPVWSQCESKRNE